MSCEGGGLQEAVEQDVVRQMQEQGQRESKAQRQREAQEAVQEAREVEQENRREAEAQHAASEARAREETTRARVQRRPAAAVARAVPSWQKAAAAALQTAWRNYLVRRGFANAGDNGGVGVENTEDMEDAELQRALRESLSNHQPRPQARADLERVAPPVGGGGLAREELLPTGMSEEEQLEWAMRESI